MEVTLYHLTGPSANQCWTGRSLSQPEPAQYGVMFILLYLHDILFFLKTRNSQNILDKFLSKFS